MRPIAAQVLTCMTYAYILHYVWFASCIAVMGEDQRESMVYRVNSLPVHVAINK